MIFRLSAKSSILRLGLLAMFCLNLLIKICLSAKNPCAAVYWSPVERVIHVKMGHSFSIISINNTRAENQSNEKYENCYSKSLTIKHVENFDVLNLKIKIWYNGKNTNITRLCFDPVPLHMIYDSEEQFRNAKISPLTFETSHPNESEMLLKASFDFQELVLKNDKRVLHLITVHQDDSTEASVQKNQFDLKFENQTAEDQSKSCRMTVSFNKMHTSKDKNAVFFNRIEGHNLIELETGLPIAKCITMKYFTMHSIYPERDTSFQQVEMQKESYSMIKTEPKQQEKTSNYRKRSQTAGIRKLVKTTPNLQVSASLSSIAVACRMAEPKFGIDVNSCCVMQFALYSLVCAAVPGADTAISDEDALAIVGLTITALKTVIKDTIIDDASYKEIELLLESLYFEPSMNDYCDKLKEYFETGSILAMKLIIVACRLLRIDLIIKETFQEMENEILCLEGSSTSSLLIIINSSKMEMYSIVKQKDEKLHLQSTCLTKLGFKILSFVYATYFALKSAANTPECAFSPKNIANLAANSFKSNLNDNSISSLRQSAFISVFPFALVQCEMFETDEICAQFLKLINYISDEKIACLISQTPFDQTFSLLLLLIRSDNKKLLNLVAAHVKQTIFGNGFRGPQPKKITKTAPKINKALVKFCVKAGIFPLESSSNDLNENSCVAFVQMWIENNFAYRNAIIYKLFSQFLINETNCYLYFVLFKELLLPNIFFEFSVLNDCRDEAQSIQVITNNHPCNKQTPGPKTYFYFKQSSESKLSIDFADASQKIDYLKHLTHLLATSANHITDSSILQILISEDYNNALSYFAKIPPKVYRVDEAHLLLTLFDYLQSKFIVVPIHDKFMLFEFAKNAKKMIDLLFGSSLKEEDEAVAHAIVGLLLNKFEISELKVASPSNINQIVMERASQQPKSAVTACSVFFCNAIFRTRNSIEYPLYSFLSSCLLLDGESGSKLAEALALKTNAFFPVLCGAARAQFLQKWYWLNASLAFPASKTNVKVEEGERPVQFSTYAAELCLAVAADIVVNHASLEEEFVRIVIHFLEQKTVVNFIDSDFIVLQLLYFIKYSLQTQKPQLRTSQKALLCELMSLIAADHSISVKFQSFVHVSALEIANFIDQRTPEAFLGVMRNEINGEEALIWYLTCVKPQISLHLKNMLSFRLKKYKDCPLRSAYPYDSDFYGMTLLNDHQNFVQILSVLTNLSYACVITFLHSPNVENPMLECYKLLMVHEKNDASREHHMLMFYVLLMKDRNIEDDKKELLTSTALTLLGAKFTKFLYLLNCIYMFKPFDLAQAIETLSITSFENDSMFLKIFMINVVTKQSLLVLEAFRTAVPYQRPLLFSIALNARNSLPDFYLVTELLFEQCHHVHLIPAHYDIVVRMMAATGTNLDAVFEAIVNCQLTKEEKMTLAVFVQQRHSQILNDQFAFFIQKYINSLK